MAEVSRYQFGPLEHRGLIGGLRSGQVALVGGALVIGVGLLYLLPVGINAFAALGLVLLAAAVAFWPVRGRSVEEWTPVVFAWLGRRVRGRHRHRSRAPVIGARLKFGASANGNGKEPEGPELPVHLPDAVGAVEILSVPYRGGTIGVLKESPTFFTAVLQCRVRSFGLLESSEQERRLAGWGEVLSSFAGERIPIRRLQWVERTVPSDGDEVTRYFSEERDRAVPLSSPSIRSYIELIDAAGSVTQDHELFVAVQLDARRARSAIRKLVRARGEEEQPRDRRGRIRQVDEAACDLLRREAETLVNRLEVTDIRVDGALPPAALSRCLRDAYDPYGRTNRTRLAAREAGRNGAGPGRAWPVAAEESWTHYQTDSALHVTYWIAQWPRVEVGATFLSPLLMQTPVLRSIGVTLEPISPMRSMRAAEQAMTSEMADEAMRERHGFVTSARKRLQQHATSRREEELAAGHAEMRMAGFVTVSARDEDELDRACAEVEHAAQQSHIELERMYGQQATSFTFALPMCRGLQ